MYEYILQHFLCFDDDTSMVQLRLRCFSGMHKIVMLCAIFLLHFCGITMFFLSTNRFREPQSHQPHIRVVPIYHSIRRMYESFLGISTVFFRTDSIIRIFFITTLSIWMIYMTRKWKPSRNVIVINRWYIYIYMTILIISIYVFLDAKFDFFNLGTMISMINIKTSWIFLCLLGLLLNIIMIIRKHIKDRKKMNAVDVVSSKMKHKTTASGKYNSRNGEKYKVHSNPNDMVDMMEEEKDDDEAVSIDILLSEKEDKFSSSYRYFNVNGMKRRLAPREEGDVYDQTWKTKIKMIERKEKHDNDFDFDRDDLGNSKRG